MAYQQQLSQVDWPTTQATVYQVDKHRERSGRNHTRDCYDVQYRYVVEGQTYTGGCLASVGRDPGGGCIPSEV